MLRAILFDFNGVLVDDEPVHCRLIQRILAEEQLELDDETYYREYVGFDDAAAFRHAFAKANRSLEETMLRRLVARKSVYYQTEIQQNSYPFFDGAVDLVRAAAERGLTLGVVSGALHSEVDAALRQEGVLPCFKALVTAEHVAASKPSPEGYLKGIQELNSRPPLPDRLFHPHEILAVEDTVAGLEAAQGAGLRTLAVAHTYQVAELTVADLVVGRIGELSIDWLEAELERVS